MNGLGQAIFCTEPQLLSSANCEIELNCGQGPTEEEGADVHHQSRLPHTFMLMGVANLHGSDFPGKLPWAQLPGLKEELKAQITACSLQQP